MSGRSRIAGIGIGNGDRSTTHQQARCEHANTRSKAQMRQNHDLPPPSKLLAPTFATFWHSPTIGYRALQAKSARTVNSKPFLRRLDAQSAGSGSANDGCAQRGEASR